LCDLPKFDSENLIVGVETSDDAAVYKMNDDQAIIQTLDFFTPIVDDPYMFGQIAAANSLSDVYAMGGKPIVALNIVGFPECLDTSILKEILKGGADKVKEAGALLVGGHTVSDDEPKYGLSVTGEVHPDKVLKNAGALPGDVLVLTKPIGTGILNTAIKADMLSEEEITNVTDTMRTLNKVAADPLGDFTVHACTDITGFGLAGHAFEMADGSQVTIKLHYNKIPILPNVETHANMGLVPGGTYRNKKYIGDRIQFINEESHVSDILFDPQTSGGLLVALPKDEVEDLLAYYENHLETPFEVVGEVIEKGDYALIVE
jgi:selenide,water dikinase